VETLLETGVERVIATTRTPGRLADLADRGVVVRRASFDEPGALEEAFAGAERMVLVSTDSASRCEEQHEAAIHAAQRAGVKHVVFTSRWHPERSTQLASSAALRRTEIALAQTNLSWTILRNNLYTEALFDLLDVRGAMTRGEIVAATGDGGVSIVTREDCARAAAAAVTSTDTSSRILEISGPAEVRVHQLAALMGQLVGKAVRYRPVSRDVMRRRLAKLGTPPALAEAIVAFQVAIASGAFAWDSDDFATLTGTVPTSFVGYLKAHLDEAKDWAKGVKSWTQVS
jgi:NAD(P)H dehydrogenase (quinone)